MTVLLNENEVLELAIDVLDMIQPNPDRVHDIAERMDMEYDEKRDMFLDVEGHYLRVKNHKGSQLQATIERLEELLIDKEILLEAAKNGCDQREATIERQSKLLEAADKVINLCDKPNPEFSVKGLPETFDQYLKEYTSMKSQQTQQ